jgi:uncharacterized protein with PQ loop repeat
MEVELILWGFLIFGVAWTLHLFSLILRQLVVVTQLPILIVNYGNELFWLGVVWNLL